MDKDKSKSFNFEANNIEVQSSTNKMYIVGCIATIDEASEGSPHGADGKKVILSSKNAEKCIKTFKGQPMNCIFENWGYVSDTFTDHGNQYLGKYFGFIEDAWQDEKKLMAKIVVWKEAFPQLASTIINAQRSLGFSIEIYPIQLHEEEDQIIIDKWEAFGCALLWRNCAAFGEETYIEKLVASLEKSRNIKEGKGDVEMTKEEIQSIVSSVSEEVTKHIDERIAGLGIENIKASIEDLKQAKIANEPVSKDKTEAKIVEELKTMFKAEFDALKKELEASNDIPKPKSYTSNTDLGADNDYVKHLEKIDASDMSITEKLKAKARIQFNAEKKGIKIEDMYRPLF